MPAIASATLKATTLTGTLSTAAQPNVTSLGTLTSLTVSGESTFNNHVNVTAAAVIRWGSTAALPALRRNLTVLEVVSGDGTVYLPFRAESATFNAGLTVSAGTTAVQALTATTVVQSGVNAAAAGAVRLGNGGILGWRNSANTADATLTLSAADILTANVPFTTSGGITATTGTFSGHGTTASAANAFLDSGTGLLSRSTSSLRYKAVVGDYTAAEAWRLIERTRAIAYTPKEGGKEHVGLAAEWMHDLDPRFTTEDKDGQPDWVQYPHLTAPLMVALADMKRRLEAAGLWN